jgi:hypothetical protein
MSKSGAKLFENKFAFELKHLLACFEHFFNVFLTGADPDLVRSRTGGPC